MPFDNLLVQRESRVAVLTIQRPQRLNALDASTLDDIRQAVLDCQQDESIRCVIVTGSGKRSVHAIASSQPPPSASPFPRAGREALTDRGHEGRDEGVSREEKS